MTDATEAIAHVRRLCEMPYPDTYSGHYGFGTMHTILAHIDALTETAERNKWMCEVMDAEVVKQKTTIDAQAAEITKLRAVASELVGFAESGRVTGTTIADRVRVDALIGKLRDAMKDQK